MPNTILIIDDNEEFVSSLQIELETEGYIVATALNPVSGWKEMERCQPDIMLIDWQLPQMSGLELVKMIKADELHRSRYTIIITGRSGTRNIVQGLDSGADDYLNKTFELDELLARIRSGLRIRSLENRISEETRRLTKLEVALSVADTVGNPLVAAKIYQQLLVANDEITNIPEVLESLKTIGQLINEALNIINKFHSLKSALPATLPEQELPAIPVEAKNT
ncbi:MAG: DNA-binding response regulator [Ignavibacteriae bacterium]|nr:MAG: DNA-binding response regulator [Ignavibacteriota bacterium]